MKTTQNKTDAGYIKAYAHGVRKLVTSGEYKSVEADGEGAAGARMTALERYVEALVKATIEYDKTGDHYHSGPPYPGDCIRCNVVAALPNTDVVRISKARRGGL